MLNVYIRPDFSPDRDCILGAVRGRIEALLARGRALSPELCMDAVACIIDGALIEFGGHVREAAFDYALRHYGTEPTQSSAREYLLERRAHEKGRAEALSDVKLAFASHSFRASLDGGDSCAICDLSQAHDVHLAPGGRATTVGMIKDVLGTDFPVAATWSGYLRVEADRYAECAQDLSSPDHAEAA